MKKGKVKMRETEGDGKESVKVSKEISAGKEISKDGPMGIENIKGTDQR